MGPVTPVHGEAWMVLLAPEDAGAVDALMDAAAYQAFAEAESK